ncbi:MAG: cytochrome c3 family protein [Phycisphaerae bacterium]|nr:NapC/NirT family cytochrome c [Phycisphaerae bacterium]NUQ48115.1 cytochrome c3 family protein [Phycisphaerae bacterium]
MMPTESNEPMPPRDRPWWAPFVTLSVILAVLGGLALSYAEGGGMRAIGRASLAAAAIAITGVLLSLSAWGRAIMGIYVRPTSHWFPFLFSRRGWAQATAISFVFFVTGFFAYTMEPDFCTSCHIMVPYYRAWHESTHHGVECIECHFEPGLKGTLKGKWQASSMLIRYLTNTYGSKPHAQIEDASCLRSGCHAERVLEGKGKADWVYQKPNGATVTIKFDHTPHLGELRRGRQLRCTSCHSQIVQGEHIAVTLDTCYVCHFKGLVHGRDEEVLGGCTGCHAAPKEEIRLSTGVFDHKAYIDRGVACYNCHSDSIKGDGAVPKQVCVNCHNQPHLLERYGEANFIHDNHVTKHKLRCTSCHLEIEHSIDAGVQKPEASCVVCHQSMHAGPSELYRGTGGRGVPDMPSPMYRAQVDCIGCHRMREHDAMAARVVGQTFVAMQESCDMCHGDEGDPQTGKYADRLSEWKRVLDARLAEVEADVTAAESALASTEMSDGQRLTLARRVSDARHNVALVRLGHGAHNFNYSIALLSVATEYAKEVQRTCDPDGPAARGSP